ncbi:TlpA family protein disulfide reductase [Formosa sp. S-31]|uniref:TlpA family protein disulfide reductase n=1 Tax=Formosa sp. S-31 TaxID=2790949 RepID=UPI003EBD8782
MKLTKSQRSNLWFLAVLIILIVPQTRKPIQVFLQKGLAKFSPSVIAEAKQEQLRDYNWKLVDLSGQAYDFSQSKGHVVLVNFWATWCPPCIAEMDGLVALHDAYKEQVDFLFISNEPPETVQSFLKQKGYKLQVYRSATAVPELLETSSIPRTLVIDKTGRVVIDKTGASNWNSNLVHATLEDLLKN